MLVTHAGTLFSTLVPDIRKADITGVSNLQIPHREVSRVVGDENGGMRASRAGDQGVGEVKGPSLPSPVRLVATRLLRRLLGRRQVLHPVQQRLHGPAFRLPHASLDLSDVHARCAKRVPSPQQRQQSVGYLLVAPQMGDEDRRIQ